MRCIFASLFSLYFGRTRTTSERQSRGERTAILGCRFAPPLAAARGAQRRSSPWKCTKKNEMHFCISFFFVLWSEENHIRTTKQGRTKCYSRMSVRPIAQQWHEPRRGEVVPESAPRKMRNASAFLFFFVLLRDKNPRFAPPLAAARAPKGRSSPWKCTPAQSPAKAHQVRSIHFFIPA